MKEMKDEISGTMDDLQSKLTQAERDKHQMRLDSVVRKTVSGVKVGQ